MDITMTLGKSEARYMLEVAQEGRQAWEDFTSGKTEHLHSADLATSTAWLIELLERALEARNA